MTIPYRTRRILQRVAVTVLALVLAAALIWACWLLWLHKYIIYSADEGAILDFQLQSISGEGVLAQPPEEDATISIYYNEGENAINTSKELTQLSGYYADSTALEDISTVLSQIQALPAGTAVMVDVKNIYGSFYYSSTVSEKRSSSIDTAAMDELIEYLDTSAMYTIARLPALRDYAYGLNHVSDGLPTAGGYLWMDDDGCYWLNPSSEGTIAYLAQIVSELKSLGFDEVVFDDFYFPDTSSIVFSGDRPQALAAAAQTLVTTCATESFAVSFTGDASFTLPDGRSRLYVESASAADAASIAQQTGIADTAIRLVFLTEVHDTRFDVYSVLRPLSAAH